jgi:hypothetical protein
MGAVSFDQFVRMVREPLCVLDVEPAFRLENDRARFMWPPYIAELEAIDDLNLRFSVSAHGELLRTVELPMTSDAAWLAWNGIVAIFEMIP